MDAAKLPIGSPGKVVTWTDGGLTNIAAWQEETGYSLVFQQRTSLLFADLRDQQRGRDVVLTVALASAVAALVAFGLYRELSARRQRERLSQMLDGVGDLVLLLGPDQKIRFVGSAANALLGFDPPELVDRSVLDLVNPADVDRMTGLLHGVDDGPELDVRLRARSGDDVWFDLESSDLSGDLQLSDVVVTGHDATERRTLQQEVARRARGDPLTGLGNRGAFRDELHNAARDAAATGV
nr:GGDEF domain-containing protein [Micromonospora sp. DSM 115978]